MSTPTIAPYFPFRRIKIVDQTVRGHRSSHSGAARQAVSTRLPRMRSEGFWCSQLAPAQGSGPEPCHCPAVDHLPVSQSVLCSLSRHPYREFGAVSPLSAGDNSIGPLYLSAVPVDDRIRSGSAPGLGLENGQSHRQVLFATRLRSTRLAGAAHFGHGRNLHPKGLPLPECRTGLSQRPRGLCRERPQVQNPGKVFQSVERHSAQRHRGSGHGYVGPVYKSR